MIGQRKRIRCVNTWVVIARGVWAPPSPIGYHSRLHFYHGRSLHLLKLFTQ